MLVPNELNEVTLNVGFGTGGALSSSRIFRTVHRLHPSNELFKSTRLLKSNNSLRVGCAVRPATDALGW
jgi:hypothetical protein